MKEKMRYGFLLLLLLTSTYTLSMNRGVSERLVIEQQYPAIYGNMIVWICITDVGPEIYGFNIPTQKGFWITLYFS